MLPLEFKIADFGIAKDLSVTKHHNLKQGTLKYMGPEQFVAHK